MRRFLIDHDPTRVAGQFHQLSVIRGWLVGAFTLNDTAAGAIAADRLRVGSPISVGFDPRSVFPDWTPPDGVPARLRLNEASLVDEAAYKGAMVTLKCPFPVAVPTEKPKPKRTPTPTLIRHDPPPAVARRPTPAEEDAEFRRRLDWLAPDVPFELIIANMTSELRAIRRR